MVALCFTCFDFGGDYVFYCCYCALESRQEQSGGGAQM